MPLAAFLDVSLNMTFFKRHVQWALSIKKPDYPNHIQINDNYVRKFGL